MLFFFYQEAANSHQFLFATPTKQPINQLNKIHPTLPTQIDKCQKSGKPTDQWQMFRCQPCGQKMICLFPAIGPIQLTIPTLLFLLAPTSSVSILNFCARLQSPAGSEAVFDQLYGMVIYERALWSRRRSGVFITSNRIHCPMTNLANQLFLYHLRRWCSFQPLIDQIAVFGARIPIVRIRFRWAVKTRSTNIHLFNVTHPLNGASIPSFTLSARFHRKCFYMRLFQQLSGYDSFNLQKKDLCDF